MKGEVWDEMLLLRATRLYEESERTQKHSTDQLKHYPPWFEYLWRKPPSTSRYRDFVGLQKPGADKWYSYSQHKVVLNHRKTDEIS